MFTKKDADIAFGLSILAKILNSCSVCVSGPGISARTVPPDLTLWASPERKLKATLDSYHGNACLSVSGVRRLVNSASLLDVYYSTFHELSHDSWVNTSTKSHSQVLS